MQELFLLLTAVFAGGLGAILGLGGGIIVIPVLTLGYGIDIRYAIAASLISIVATSSGAAASYLRDSLTNLRLAVFLEIGTVTGAVLGFLIASYAKAQFLYFLFGGFLLFSALMMLRKRAEHTSSQGHPWAHALRLNSSYPDASGKLIHYQVENVPFGLIAM
ncbi:MAG: sulfite exporter TauE/SafE family protein, partial [Proteobacteria bacterium]